MKHLTPSGSHPITWESLLAVFGAVVLAALIFGGIVFWLNFFGA